jgi:NADPH:quinone reductase-like Zn-dependent oxidoreductase
MIAARYKTHGPPEEVLTLSEIARSVPGPGEIRVAVEASPVDPLDILLIHGHYPLRSDLPATAGVEGAGRITGLGADVKGFEEGQRVLLPIRCGAWSEECTAPATDVLALPEGIDPQQACMLPINGATAFLLLSLYEELGPGAWIIQQPGSSSVGQYVVQLAARMGLKTVSVIRREERGSVLQERGADVLVLEGPNLAERVAKATGREEILVALDAMGGAATHALARCLAPGGRVVSYGALSRRPAQIGVDQTIFRSIRLEGFWLFDWNLHAGTERAHALLSDLARAVSEGLLNNEVAATYPLSDLHAALDHARDPARSGRVLICPSD